MRPAGISRCIPEGISSCARTAFHVARANAAQLRDAAPTAALSTHATIGYKSAEESRPSGRATTGYLHSHVEIAQRCRRFEAAGLDTVSVRLDGATKLMARSLARLEIIRLEEGLELEKG